LMARQKMEMTRVATQRGFPSLRRGPFSIRYPGLERANRTEASEPSRSAGQHSELREIDSHPVGRVSTADGSFSDTRIGENRPAPLSGFDQGPDLPHQMPILTTAAIDRMLL
jgi:hypothetical protein